MALSLHVFPIPIPPPTSLSTRRPMDKEAVVHIHHGILPCLGFQSRWNEPFFWARKMLSAFIWPNDDFFFTQFQLGRKEGRKGIFKVALNHAPPSLEASFHVQDVTFRAFNQYTRNAHSGFQQYCLGPLSSHFYTTKSHKNFYYFLLTNLKAILMFLLLFSLRNTIVWNPTF